MCYNLAGDSMKYFLIIIAALLVIVFVMARNSLMRTIGRNKLNLPIDPQKVPESHRKYVRQSYDALQAVKDDKFEELVIVSEDGLKLTGRLFRFNPENNRVVIGFHGYHAYGLRDMGRFAKFYKDLGYDYLIINQRTHYESEGTYITFGCMESHDGVSWVNKIIELYGADVEIAVHGISMGGATVLMMSGLENLPPQVKGIISDCSYSNMYDETSYVMKKNGNSDLRRRSMLAFMMLYQNIFVGCNLKDASPVKSVENAKVPALLIHGEADDYVPFHMLDIIDKAYNNEHYVYTVANAAHADSYSVDELQYQKQVEVFLKKVMGRGSGL